MDPRPHTTVLPRNNLIWIEISVSQSLQYMNPLYFDLHNLFVLLFLKGQNNRVKKLETVEKRKFRIRGLNNKVILEMGIQITLWL